MRALLSLAAISLVANLATAQTTTVQLQASLDNTLYEDAAGLLSNGLGQYLFVGVNSTAAKRRALLAFDVVAVVPPKSRIVDVQLHLMASQSNAVAPTVATLHRATAAWGEGPSVAGGGEGGGGTALPGDATWLHAVAPGALWTLPGGDFDPVPSSTTSMPVTGPFVFERTEELIADVQRWIDGSLANHGWIVKTAETATDAARRLDSRDNTSMLGVRPRLTITYLPPGNVESFGAGCVTSGNVPFTQTINSPVQQGQNAILSTSSGVPIGLFVTVMSYDVRPYPHEHAPGCFVWLRQLDYPLLMIRTQDITGVSTDSFPIPFEPGLFGMPIAFQSILVDWASPRQWALSNANLICIR
jgi:hypothetical protein